MRNCSHVTILWPPSCAWHTCQQKVILRGELAVNSGEFSLGTQAVPFCRGKAEAATCPLNLPTYRNAFFFFWKSFMSKVAMPIASVHQLTYHQFPGTQKRRKCRKIYVTAGGVKADMLFIESAVWEDTKVNILTAALPTLAILWRVSQYLLLLLRLRILV